MKFELVVIWETGEKDIFEYENEREAEQAGANMTKAFGRQISWVGTRQKRGEMK